MIAELTWKRPRGKESTNNTIKGEGKGKLTKN
jgi:hypothetical protein